MVQSFVTPANVGYLLVLSTVAVVIHRLFIHALAKYPGPLLSKLTDWNEFFAVKTGDHHIWLLDLHEKYGPVVRVAPNRLSYNTVEGLRSIYGDRKANIRKSGFTEMLNTLSGGRRNLQTLNERHAYQIRRRLISHAFSEEALRSSEEYIITCVRKWCGILASKAKDTDSWTSDIDMRVWANVLTEDILGELCFGGNFGALDQGYSDNADFATEGAKQAQQLCWMPVPDAFYRVLGAVVAYGKKQRWKAVMPQLNFEESVQGMIDRRLAADVTSRKDFFHYILQAKDEETGESISPVGLRNESGVLFGAGMDTSATCIATCLFYLTRYPEVLAKVVDEVRGSFSNVEDITHGQQLNSLVYLRACIDETLRISPPVPGPLLRQVTAGDLMVDEQFVPSGVEVSVAAYAIHHNEKYFPDSWTFNPDRWLSDKSLASRDAFFAFSSGQRVCIGRQLAYLDMTLALARLLFSFDIRRSSGSAMGLNDRGRIEYQLKDWFITGRDGPFIQLKARSQ